MSHPPDEDKHGNDISLFVAEAVREVRKHERVQRVEVCHHTNGLLQVWTTDRHVGGELIRLAREMGYEVADATNRRAEQLPESVETYQCDRVGYAEFVPETDHGHGTYDADPIRTP